MANGVGTKARRRGIQVDVLDAEGGFFSLTHGGRTVTCRESLSELTSAIAMSRCDDKSVTRRILGNAGLRVPAQITVTSDKQAFKFLAQHGSVVVKAARGEQGHGVFVDLRTREDVLEDGKTLAVRKTANLHTGGTIHDVTDVLHPPLVDAAIKAARFIDLLFPQTKAVPEAK